MILTVGVRVSPNRLWFITLIEVIPIGVQRTIIYVNCNVWLSSIDVHHVSGSLNQSVFHAIVL